VSIFGAKRPLIVGMALFTLGLMMFWRTPVDGAFVPDIIVPMLVMGFGAGIAFMPLFLIATNDVAPSESGLISGVLATSQMIGGSIGLAVLAGVAAAATSLFLGQGADPKVAMNDGYHAAFLIAAGLAALTAVLAWTQLREPKKVEGPMRLESGAAELAA
jgi:MFS family permease